MTEPSGFRIFVLGAGFSQPAGLPLGSELWAEIRRRARRHGAEYLERDVQSYLAFRRDCDEVVLSPGRVDFEDFVAFLDVEHTLWLRGKDTWSEDGNESQLLIRWLIGEILTEKTPPVESVPELYRRFADRLRPGDHVLTFNYDVLLERALESVGRPYRLFPNVLKNVHAGYAEVETTDEVVILKLHGSVDWFDMRRHEAMNRARAAHGSPPDTDDPIFGSHNRLDVSPLTHGERRNDDPLAKVFRVRSVERLYGRGWPLGTAPLLMSPSTLKMLYVSPFVDFYRGLDAAGVLNLGLCVIGYSLPKHDHHARQLLYTVFRNYQGRYWGRASLAGFGMAKQTAKIIDLCPDDTRADLVRRRYGFVDWRRAQLHRSGFDEEALSVIFDAARRPSGRGRRLRGRPSTVKD